MTTREIIKRLPYELAARLSAAPGFDVTPIVVADEGNVLATISQRQAALQAKGGKLGVTIVVCQMLIEDEHPNLQFGPMVFKPSFQVIEQRELNLGKNGTCISCREWCRMIVDVFKNVPFPGFVSGLEADKELLTGVEVPERMANTIAYQVNFRCMEISLESRGQVQQPQFADVANAVSITCPTAGADIWYTTDDSYPVPKSIVPTSTAQQYRDPVAVPQGGFILRAVAYGPPLVASICARGQVTPV